MEYLIFSGDLKKYLYDSYIVNDDEIEVEYALCWTPTVDKATRFSDNGLHYHELKDAGFDVEQVFTNDLPE